METLANSIRAKLYHSNYNPFSWVFVGTWLIWNYRFLLVLVSSMSVEEKFEFIDLELFPTLHIMLSQGFFYPLATTIALVIFYPYPARLIYKLSLMHHAKMRRARQRMEEQQLLSSKESKDILDTLNNLRSDYTSNNEFTNAQIRGLNSQIETLKEQLEQAAHQASITRAHSHPRQEFYDNENGEPSSYQNNNNQDDVFDKVDTKNMISLQDNVKEALSDSRKTIDEVSQKFSKFSKSGKLSTEERNQNQFIHDFLCNFFCCEQKICEVLICFLDIKMKYGDNDQKFDAEVQLQLTPKANKFNKHVADYNADFAQFKQLTNFEFRSIVEDYFTRLMEFRDVEKDFDTQAFTQSFAHLRRTRKSLLKQVDKFSKS